MMRLILGLLFIFSAVPLSNAQPQQASPPNPQNTEHSKAAPVIRTEKVQVPEEMQTPPSSMSSQPGYMLPSQAGKSLVKIWDSEQRIRDLLSQVHPEVLKMPPALAQSLEQNVAAVNKAISTLEDARARFAGRPDSEYFGFETFSGISELLPRLSEIADAVYRYQNQSLGSDIRQAWNDLFTRGGALASYVAFLARNHDQIYAVTQGNLYNCETQLTQAMRGRTERAIPMRNILPEFKGHPRHKKKPTVKSPAMQKPQS